MHAPRCETIAINQSRADEIQRELEDIPTQDIGALFKVLADPTRLRIAYALTVETELCVCDVSASVDCSIATASHHLRTLLKQGLVKYRKEGKVVYYSLDDFHVSSLITMAMEHVAEGKAVR
ncbi:ArsR/SmtB family transcription factor [Exiguobacterium flavidum]|uniref:ArsR/SmtB family transcription factor n=1 Tax=Exiguobacterium flavidum TaxID=2184695 RepID=UPI000DF818F9|nr:metalloregulator ArsR/SmtB family transcription factor [Exiguobacterium flavidum]